MSSAVAEIKFLVTSSQAEAVHRWARGHLAPDPNGAGPYEDCYRTTSLYCDTAGFDVLRKRGSYGRGKYRVRLYGQGPVVFLERKLKMGCLVTKRRSVVSMDEIAALGERPPVCDDASYWFHRRLLKRRLEPVCQISYDRIARVGSGASGAIRLTIDRALTARPASGFRFLPRGGAEITAQAILELKFPGAMPELFRELCGKFGLETAPVSKYRLAAVALGYPMSRGGSLCVA